MVPPESTLDALENIELVEETEGGGLHSELNLQWDVDHDTDVIRLDGKGDAASPPSLQPNATFGAGGTLQRLKEVQNVEFEDEVVIDPIEREDDGPLDLHPSVSGRAAPQRRGHTGTSAMTSVVPNAIASSDSGEFETEPPKTARIHVDKYVIRGHAVNFFFTLIAVPIIFVLLSQMSSATPCRVLQQGFLFAFIFDLTIAQTATLVFAYVYRWLVADDDEKIWSELHPLEGERRPY